MKSNGFPSDQLGRGGSSQGNAWELPRRFFSRAALGKPIREYLSDVAEDLVLFTPCDEVEIWLRHRQDDLRLVCGRGDTIGPRFLPRGPSIPDQAGFEELCRGLIEGGTGGSTSSLTPNRSLVIEDSNQPVQLGSGAASQTFRTPGPFSSLVLLPFEGHSGESVDRRLLVLKWSKARRFSRDELHVLEEVTRSLAQAAAARRAHAALRERMKELTCLHEIGLLKQDPAASLEGGLLKIIEILTEALLYPEDAWSRIELGESTFEVGPCPRDGPALRREIRVGGERRGFVEVGYATPKPPLDTGPFLWEEQRLLETVAREISHILERRAAAEESEQLQAQLRHAERLATIGEMAAGIAHELNDPLNNILGFAELTEASLELEEATRRDVSMIVTSAVHAREVIRQLLLFSRQSLQTGMCLDLSQVVRESLTFLGAICAKAHVELIHRLSLDLPTIWANPDELRQVLVNLVVNATQATQEGGKVTITTDEPEGEVGVVQLTVEDNGSGMTEEEIEKVFLPFYTTRKEGTGLGLAVVHGIVTSHEGSIRLKSDPTTGTRFEIVLPVSQARQEEPGE